MSEKEEHVSKIRGIHPDLAEKIRGWNPREVDALHAALVEHENRKEFAELVRKSLESEYFAKYLKGLFGGELEYLPPGGIPETHVKALKNSLAKLGLSKEEVKKLAEAFISE